MSTSFLLVALLCVSAPKVSAEADCHPRADVQQFAPLTTSPEIQINTAADSWCFDGSTSLYCIDPTTRFTVPQRRGSVEEITHQTARLTNARSGQKVVTRCAFVPYNARSPPQTA